MSHMPIADRIRSAAVHALQRSADTALFGYRARRLVPWILENRPVPPPHCYKALVVKWYRRKYSLRALIETGTYHGAMLEAVRWDFDRIYSIELDNTLFTAAVARFARSQHIAILQGDSGSLLPQLLSSLHEPCLFWLDAHYSGGVTARGEQETPVVTEVSHILRHPYAQQHVVLIDDARCFVAANNYPSIEGLREVVRGFFPERVFEVSDDIIRIHCRGKCDLSFCDGRS
jgi:hypothetical protein